MPPTVKSLRPGGSCPIYILEDPHAARLAEWDGDVASILMYRDYAIRTYLLFVVGTTIFS
ncbi:hypothetical protein A2U01_0109139, partial [Trifolium medium]|nr:hypothetical protein [Trifolium medium]